MDDLTQNKERINVRLPDNGCANFHFKQVLQSQLSEHQTLLFIAFALGQP
jgi:hypothetical protein